MYISQDKFRSYNSLTLVSFSLEEEEGKKKKKKKKFIFNAIG